MHVEAGHLYHLCNQGNNREQLFFCDEDYLCFLKQVKKHLSPVCEIVAWCLMPNHFHFCIQATDASVQERASGKLMIQSFSKAVGLMTSTYANMLNAQQSRFGTRFKQKATLKRLTDGDGRYDITVVHYIHNNPVRAGLVLLSEEWIWSSASDYAGLRNGKLCNLDLGRRLGLLG